MHACSFLVFERDPTSVLSLLLLRFLFFSPFSKKKNNHRGKIIVILRRIRRKKKKKKNPRLLFLSFENGENHISYRNYSYRIYRSIR